MDKDRRFAHLTGFMRPSKERRGAAGRGGRSSDWARNNPHGCVDSAPKDASGVDSRHGVSSRGKEVTEEGLCESPGRHKTPRDVNIDLRDPTGARALAVPPRDHVRGSSSSSTPSSYAPNRFRHEVINDRRTELEYSGRPLLSGLHFTDPYPKLSGLPHLEEGLICSESNALVLAQAAADACPVDKMVYRAKLGGRMAEWMGHDLVFSMSRGLAISNQLLGVTQEALNDRDVTYKKCHDVQKELVSLNQRYGALNEKYEASQILVNRLERKLKDHEGEFSARLERAKGRSEELECTIVELKGRISELEQQCPASMDEIVRRWKVSDEGKEAIFELSRPYIKSGYHLALCHYLPEISPESEWTVLPSPYRDIGLMDNSIPFYHVDGPSILTNIVEEGEDEETPVIDS